MSSPLGGSFIAAINKRQATKFKLKSRTKINLSIVLLIDNTVYLKIEQIFYVGEKSCFESDRASIKVNSEILDSGLLHVECCVDLKNQDAELSHVGSQIVNLEHGELITTLIEGNSNAKIKVVATSS